MMMQKAWAPTALSHFMVRLGHLQLSNITVAHLNLGALSSVVFFSGAVLKLEAALFILPPQLLE